MFDCFQQKTNKGKQMKERRRCSCILSWNWASFQERVLFILFKNIMNEFIFLNCNSNLGIVSGAIFRINLILNNSYFLSL